VNLAALDLSILLPALAAGLLVTATHVPLGMQVLARGIVFIDLAIAQIAGCGVVLADRFGFEAEGIAVQLAAFSAALGGALLLTWTERIWPDVQEAVIGVVFVLGATGSVMLLASNAHGSEHLRDLLVGQILWAQPARLAWAACHLRGGAGAVVRMGRAHGARRLLRAVRAGGHGLGAARRPLPRLRDPDHPAACHAPHAARAAGRRLGDRRGGLCGGARGLGGVRPAERGGDRLDARGCGVGVVSLHQS
jgi:hypothetical protein